MAVIRWREDALGQLRDQARNAGPGSPGLAETPLVQLFRALQAPLAAESGPSVLETSWTGPAARVIDPALLRAMSDTVRSRSARSPWNRLRMVATTATAKMVIVGGLVLGGTAAAASTGSLPVPIQHFVARAFADVGIHLGTGASGGTSASGGPGRAASPVGGSGVTTTTTTALPGGSRGHESSPQGVKRRDGRASGEGRSSGLPGQDGSKGQGTGPTDGRGQGVGGGQSGKSGGSEGKGTAGDGSGSSSTRTGKSDGKGKGHGKRKDHGKGKGGTDKSQATGMSHGRGKVHANPHHHRHHHHSNGS
jgi:hypothetical protein